MSVQRATSTITLSNPVQQRFVTKLGQEKPQVKVIVTEILDDSSDTFDTKPRKPRKADLAKCIKERDTRIHNNQNKVPLQKFLQMINSFILVTQKVLI